MIDWVQWIYVPQNSDQLVNVLHKHGSYKKKMCTTFDGFYLNRKIFFPYQIHVGQWP